MENIRHLTFAKQDSQSSIIEIHKYAQYEGSKHEPHVQSSGSIILKEPSMASIRNRSQLKDVHSKEYLESNGGHGLKSSSHMIQTLQASNNMESLGGRNGSEIGKKLTSTKQNFDLQKDLEMKKK